MLHSASRRVVALALAASLASCGADDVGSAPRDLASAAQPAPPHIVLVLVDTLRADHTSLHGYERRTTPNLERIAAAGAWMSRHRANAPWTKPSIASLLTGLHPSAHRSRIGQFGAPAVGHDRWVEVLDSKLVTFVERLQAAGYATHAHTSNYNMHPRWGYDQGFDEFVMTRAGSEAATLAADRAARDFVRSTLAGAQRPTFVWAHMMAVHQYHAPLEDRVFHSEAATPIESGARGGESFTKFRSLEDAVDRYDAAVHFDDRLLGELFDHITREHPNTVLIVTSDHGEEFFDHGGYEHAWTLYNELLHVPLVMAGPGVPVGARATGLTDSLDLFPTILELAGIDLGGGPGVGERLFPEGAVTAGKSESFAELHHRGPFVRFALQRGDTKLTEYYTKHGDLSLEERTGALQLLECFRDDRDRETPAQRHKTSDDETSSFRERIQRYREAADAQFERTVGTAATTSVTDEDLLELKALGYGGDR